jgi:hypothetical protein
MRKSWPYLLLLIGVMTLIGYVSQKSSGRRINWEPNYRLNSKIPYGCYLLNYYLEQTIAPGTDDVDKTIYTHLRDTSYSGANYIFVNARFEPSALDVIELCRFAEEGNTVFIAANSFGLLSDTLKVYGTDAFDYYYEEDSAMTINSAMTYNYDTVRMNLVNPNLHLQDYVKLERENYSMVFGRFRTKDVTVLGTDVRGYPNFIECKMGKGKFLLHTMPLAFCNYYAAKPANAAYLFGVLSYLPDQFTLMDVHYKPYKVENDDPRRFILSEPALQLAYYIVIVAGLVALFFGGKRRQRPVPVVPPFRNATLDFVEQVGALYYRKSDHTNIIGKKINYFLESVRSRFYVNTIAIDDRLIEKVAALSGVAHPQVKRLFVYIDRMRKVNVHTDADLKQLVKMIREFNERSKR